MTFKDYIDPVTPQNVTLNSTLNPERAMPKIHIIDDDANLCIALGHYLKQFGHDVEFSTNGADGLQAIRRATPDAILCDLDMPGLNGQQVVTALRQDESIADVPILYLSGCADRKLIRQSINLGSDDYIAKPADPGEVLAALEARLKRRQQQQKRQQTRLRQAVQIFSGIVHDLDKSVPPTRWLANDGGRTEGPTNSALEDKKPSTSVLGLNSPLMVKSDNRKHFIKLSEVKALLAYGEYSRIYWGKGGQHMIFRKALKQWEQELPSAQFMRIHRGSIVNMSFLDSVEEVQPGRWQVRLRDFSAVLPVSHRARTRLNQLLRKYSPGRNFTS
jgi:CheY-like chemotaxis protein